MERIKQIGQKFMCFINEMRKVAKNIFGTYEDTSAKYTALSPVNDVKDCEEHINALEWAVFNPNIKNIAIAGPFGSGKTSVINTFLERNPFLKRNSIRISLATFPEKQSNENVNLQEEFLKQLFYKVEQKRIPQSRYRKLHKIRFLPILEMVSLCTAIIFSFFYIFKPISFESNKQLIIQAGGKIHLTEQVSMIVFCLICFVIILIASKIIQTLICRISIKEIKIIPEATMSIPESDSESVFNRNMDEIAYFFEVTDYDLVFIEDLDRFGNPEIFVQLRELNTLLNYYDAIKRKIVFVYAIKDEMFEGMDRTKFFDFIIPIIPVINSTNSDEIFMELINKRSGNVEGHDISENYILDVSPFISDMRILQNIYNEFLIYKETLKKQQGLSALLDESMMSLIIFKNLFPAHFKNLQGETGIVKSAFKNGRDFALSQTRILQEKINEKQKILEKIDDDILFEKKDLKFAMLCALTQWQGMTTKIQSNSFGTYGAADVLSDSFDTQLLLNKGDWNVYFCNMSGNINRLDRVNVAEICEPYVNRWEFLKHADLERKETLKKEIVELEAQKSNILSWNMETLLKKYNSKDVLFSKDVQDNDFLVFMLRKGYINEKYVDYINFFKGNSITVDDMNFIQSIKSQTVKPFTYSLSNDRMPQIIRKIQKTEFSERAALNFDLMEYMLSVHKHDEELEIYVGQLATEDPDNWRFIDEFIDKTKCRKRFVQLLSANWEGFWDNVYDSYTLTYERKLHYLKLICMHCDLDTLARLNQNGTIKKFFVEHQDILQHFPKELSEHLKQMIQGLDIAFSKIDIESVPTTVLDFIFDKGYYEVNSEMIRSVVIYKNEAMTENLEHQNYTTILNLGYEPLLNMVWKNISWYTDEIVLREKNTEERPDAVIDLVKRVINDAERCEAIIRHQKCVFEELESVGCDLIDNEGENIRYLWDLILEHDRINLCWDNIYVYWKAFDLSDSLINYIYRHQDTLVALDATILDDSFKAEIICSTLDSKTFNRLARCFKMRNFNLEFDEIAEDRLKPMIRWHYFKFDLSTYECLKNLVPELCNDFILENQEAFEEYIDEIILSELEFEELMLNERCNHIVKQKIVNEYGEKLMTNRVASELVQSDLQLGKTLFNAVWEKLADVKQRKDLLFKHLINLDADDFAKYLPELDAPYCKLYRNVYRHNERIDNTPKNLELVQQLIKVGYLTSYDVEPPKYYNLEFVSKILCRVKALQKG